VIPDPPDRPVMDLWPEVGQLLHLGRSATYDAARRGDIPTLRLGRRVVVPTAALRRLLALDEPAEAPAGLPVEVIATGLGDW
jgi:hypothetical protein